MASAGKLTSLNSILRHHWRYNFYKGSNNLFDYLLIVDFEATCDDSSKMTQEIIEFPCLKIELKTMKLQGIFHSYVRPIINPILTPFCTEFTGIIQEMVDSSPNFHETLLLFEKWRADENLDIKNSVYMTSGDWDFGHMLPKQCELSNVPVPEHMTSWIDLRKFYGKCKGKIPKSLRSMVEECGLKFEGRQHNGRDDCKNIWNVVKRIASINSNFEPTSKLINNYTVVK